MKLILTTALILAAGSAMAQERTAGGSLETQMTWSALSTKIGALDTQVSSTIGRMNQVVICGKKGMLYAPGHTDSKGVVDSDGDGCLATAGGGAAPTDYCYATYAHRWAVPHCDKDYYMKANIKSTDNNWDGYSGVCCYVKSGKDARVEANKADFVTKSNLNNPGGNNQVVAASIGLSFTDLVAKCKASRSTFGGNNVTCPGTDVLP